jgi:selenide,water dikinase
MARSQRIGHCICDPRKPCPCDLFIERDVCQCAGERLEEAPSTGVAPRLTQLVRNAGCASKVPPGELAEILARLPASRDARLLVGSATADDAGVFQLRPDLCLVQTVDVFTPCVDDAYTFGRIAACNSLSDVYAMGGTPVTALSILSYPVHALPSETVQEMLRGGMDQLTEAGVTLVGGHSINDEEVKLGFAVTGTVDPSKMVTNAGAQPGDALILTKPIGTGVIAFASQVGRASEAARAAAARAMTTLNRVAAEVMVRHGAHAATDVTGFGLLGHLGHLTRESRVSAEVWWEAVPLLPEVEGYAGAGLISGAAERNREYVAGMLHTAGDMPEHVVDLLCDPQTSGGLLLAVPAAAAAACLADLHAAGAEAAVIGRVLAQGEEGSMVVTANQRKADAQAAPEAATPCCAEPAVARACCGHDGASSTGMGTAAQAFQKFLAKAFAPGALDAVQKELTILALSVAVQCDPCLHTHLAKAQAMGITPEEIEEAAWLGVAFGGCKAMMFWTAFRQSGGN